MFRTHTNGELNIQNLNENVTLSGWVQTIRDKGFMIWIDLRDRYGITQLVFDADRSSAELLESANKLGREFVIQIEGKAIERVSKNPKIPTGEIEILVEKLTILNESEVPPFTIEDQTDGGEELRMKYRYLDIRRNPVKDKLIFRHKMAQKIRNYLSEKDFIEVHPNMSLGDMVKVISQSHRNIFPVTDNDNTLLGIVILDDIRNIMFRPELYNRFYVRKFMTMPPAKIEIGSNMDNVMKLFDQTNAWNLPVVENGKYIGFVSKSKIFNSYRRVLVHFSQD